MADQPTITTTGTTSTTASTHDYVLGSRAIGASGTKAVESTPTIHQTAGQPAPETPASDDAPAQEKMYSPGATSFADLDAAEAARKERWRLQELVDGFGMLSQNILRNEMIDDKPAAIAALVGELAARMLTGEATERKALERKATEQPDPAPAETKESDSAGSVLGDQASGVLVWKERGGAMRWLGTHTNHYIDRDNPPDILSAEAHQRFADRVAKGIDPAPELWIWHAPAPVGTADYLAWDDRGFLISSGTVAPEWEPAVKAITESGEVLGMSHGMPLESIRRDPNDPRIILDYRSKEISILPLDKAANLLTTFATEEAMEKGLRSDQRQRLVGMMGEDGVKQLESEIERKAKTASAKGLESKETSQSEAEAEADAFDETPAPVAEKPAEVKAATPTEKPAAKPAQEDADAPLSRGEIVEAIAAAMESVTAAFGKSINELAVSVEELQKQVSTQNKEMAAQVAEKAAATPKASVAALLSKRLNVGLGNPLAAEDPLMKGGPKEAEGEEVLYGFGGHL